MAHYGKRFAIPCVLVLLAAAPPALAADPVAAPSAPLNGWQLSSTPYGWMLNVNGNATARNHTVDINDSFFQIVEKSDSLLAISRRAKARSLCSPMWFGPISDSQAMRMTTSTSRRRGIRSPTFPMR
jgi:hypothetical protein